MWHTLSYKLVPFSETYEFRLDSVALDELTEALQFCPGPTKAVLSLFHTGNDFRYESHCLDKGATNITCLGIAESSNGCPESVTYDRQPAPGLGTVLDASVSICFVHLGPHYLGGDGQDRLFENIYKVLKPGGIVILTAKTPNKNNLELGGSFGEDNKTYTFVRKNIPTQRTYVEGSEIVVKGKKAGFDPLRETTYFHGVRDVSAQNELTTVTMQKPTS